MTNGSRAGSRPAKTPVHVGDEAIVDIGPIAHGGHFIAHLSGHTVFVRHALPGERARISITDVSSKIVRADAVEILEPSPDRVPAPCAWARPGGCGGCDFQHVERSAQLALKGQVVRDALERHAGLPGIDVRVEALDDDGSGLHWRTRVMWWCCAPVRRARNGAPSLGASAHPWRSSRCWNRTSCCHEVSAPTTTRAWRRTWRACASAASGRSWWWAWKPSPITWMKSAHFSQQHW